MQDSLDLRDHSLLSSWSLFQTIGNAAWSSALYSVIVDHLMYIVFV